MLHQRTLLGAGEPAIDPDATFTRVPLGTDDAAPGRPDSRHDSWVDVSREWLGGADSLLDALIERVAWKQGKRWMYERMVDDPRLSCWYPPTETLPDPVLAQLRAALSARYGVPFGSVGLNFYRDGNDSVAWHRDRELRELGNTRIAILTLGARRPFLIRPKGRRQVARLQAGFRRPPRHGRSRPDGLGAQRPEDTPRRAAHLVLVAVGAGVARAREGHEGTGAG